MRRLFAGLFLALAFLTGCSDEKPAPMVRLQDRQPLPQPAPETAGQTLTICIGSMITPEDGYGYYRRLLDYIGERMGCTVRALDPGNYKEVNRHLETGRADAAFVCGGPYVEGQRSFGLQLLAAPVVNGQPAYYSYLIVPTDSPAGRLADLRGKTFAFTDPQSNSGLLVPLDLLARMGETPDTFFSSYLYTYAHDRSIRAVADRIVDGAAVDSLVWDHLAASHPETTGRVRIIDRIGPFGSPPVVVRPGLDATTREKLRQVLLEIHQDPRGKEILAGMRIERFVPIADSAYDSIRHLHRLHYPNPRSGQTDRPR